MGMVERVLESEPITNLNEYVAAGGGRGLTVARDLGAAATLEQLDASGLRGRGGAGFPTATKWRSAVAGAVDGHPSAVVINAAEGEPATFKDRHLLRTNPYKVLEGALIACATVGASELTVALKAVFELEHDRLQRAIEEIDAAGWTDGIEARVVPGPSEYLFGEETALLEVIDGRQPFPRVTPPYRRGLDPAGVDTQNPASSVPLTGGGGRPVVVNNVETFANVPAILAEGPDWFREVGTPDSPGTIICTVVGRCERHGVGEVEMGTPLAEAIELIGLGPASGDRFVGALSGVANPIVPGALLDTPLTYEHMAAIGSGLGAGGFYVLDDETDVAAVAWGVARFLAVESCGQCEPCKRDGLAIDAALGSLFAPPSPATGTATDEIRDRLDTVADGARCSLAHQQERVVTSLLRYFPEVFDEHLTGDRSSTEPEPILPVVDIVDGRAILDLDHRTKQPDWSHDAEPSGSWPASRLAGQPVDIDPPRDRDRSRPSDAAVSAPKPGPDPLRPLSELHERIRRSLSRLGRAGDDETRVDAATELHHLLTLHADVTRRVVHPMAMRAAAAPADDATWRAEEREADADRRLTHLESLHDPDADVDVASVVRSLRDALDRDEAELLDLLRCSLDRADLEDLGDAIQEAIATSIGKPPPTNAAPS